MSSVDISGFSIVRNGQKYDYPFLQAIASVLPLVDEFVLLLGDSDDDTQKMVENWIQSNQHVGSNKIRLEHSTWDFSKNDGTVLADETNKALSLCKAKSWCIYIQADECLHQDDIPLIKSSLEKHKLDSNVEALAFHYFHFYGNYQVLNTDRGAYRHEVRAIKPLPGLKSFKDAQGFRFEDGRKPKAVKIKANVYHYGYVRPLNTMVEKAKDFDKMFHKEGTEELQKRTDHWKSFEYQYKPGLALFKGSHPKVMEERINQCDWTMDLEKMRGNRSFKEMIKDLKIAFENSLPFRIGEFKNYQPVSGKS